MTEAAVSNKISKETLDSIQETIEHDLIIDNVAKELLKEIIRDAVALENKKANPSLQSVIDHINGEEWSELFAQSAQRATEILAEYAAD